VGLVPFSREWLEAEGFGGFITVASLQESTAAIPGVPGVYVVCAPAPGPGRFLAASEGGWFKRKDPTVPVSTLKDRWHPTTTGLYIGKAASLRSRIGQLVRFGGGAPVGHWGGRYLWQVERSSDFLVAWREADEPRAAEVLLLAEFTERFGAQPFANIAS